MTITNELLLKQIQLGEDSVLELKDLRYKDNFVLDPHRDSMADELAAMANTGNGIIVLGVDDKSKAINGIPQDKLDIVETWLRDICNDLIKPQLLCRIQKISVPVGDNKIRIIIRVDIPKSLFVHQSPGGYFQRIGSSKRQMTPDILARLFQQRSQTRIIRFDEQPVVSAPYNALSKKLWKPFKTVLSPSDDEKFLIKLKLLSKDDDDNLYPSVGGLLMACDSPHTYLTGAYIQAVVYKGEDRNAAYQVDARDITGPLNIQIAEACKFVEKNMKFHAKKDLARRDIPQFSMQAIFEAIVNAVAHRDYSIQGSRIRMHMFSNRIEIFSPGDIPNTMTIDSLSLRQASRNELITSLLARCPLFFTKNNFGRQFIMDRRGEGVPIILSESKKLSGIDPNYEIIDNTELKLTIYSE